MERDKIIRVLSRYSEKCLSDKLDYDFARAVTAAIKELRGTKVTTSIYDQEEIHENCTVQVLTNTVTGEVSVGWWNNKEDGE